VSLKSICKNGAEGKGTIKRIVAVTKKEMATISAKVTIVFGFNNWGFGFWDFSIENRSLIQQRAGRKKPWKNSNPKPLCAKISGRNERSDFMKNV